VLGLEPAEVKQRKFNDPERQIRDLDGEPIPDEELPFCKVLDRAEAVTDQRHTIVWPDGTERVLSVNGAPIFDEDGEIESTVFALADITNRLERERDLRAALFEQNTDPILEVDLHEERAVVRAANQASYDVFGLGSDDVIGHTIAEAIVPEDRLDDHGSIAHRVSEGEPVEAEVTRRARDGLRQFVLTAIPLDVPGQGRICYAWYKDVTELRAASVCIVSSKR